MFEDLFGGDFDTDAYGTHEHVTAGNGNDDGKDKKGDGWKKFQIRMKMWSLIWIQVFVLVEFYSVWLLPNFFPNYMEMELHLQVAFSTALSTLTIEFVTYRPLMWLSKKIRYV